MPKLGLSIELATQSEKLHTMFDEESMLKHWSIHDASDRV